jgi:tetratricopeptide (TPR) repeat protein
LSAGILLVTCALIAQPAVADGDAYQAAAAGQLELAAQRFRSAIEAAPTQVTLRKDFAYLLLRMGETAAARDQFREVVRLAPSDSHAALEYAFLCHETGQQSEAWALFRDLRNARDPEHRKTARTTFARLDEELAARVNSLRAAVAANPVDEPSHTELARVLLVRNDFAKAATHFETAYRLKPEYPERLLSMAEAASKAGDTERARSALLAASRGRNAFVAEQARALLPDRYPYLYEFQNALALDPSNAALGRETGYFLLSLERRGEAAQVFRQVVSHHPDDALATAQLGFLLLEDGDPQAAIPLLRRALEHADPALQQRLREALENQPLQERQGAGQVPAAEVAEPGDLPAPATAQARPERPRPEAARQGLLPLPVPVNEDGEPAPVLARAEAARELGRKSYDSGYLPDAIRHYQAAHELDPTNFDTMLRLGYSLNMAKRDEDALQWFFLAARSPEPQIATEATRALRNLTTPAPSGAAQAQATAPASGIVSSFWAMPMHSTRWGKHLRLFAGKVGVADGWMARGALCIGALCWRHHRRDWRGQPAVSV